MSRSADSTTLFVTRSTDRRAVAEACARVGARGLVVAGPHVDAVGSMRQVCIGLGDDADLSVLATERYDRVLLHGFGPHDRLPSPLLRDVFSRNLRSIRHVSDAGELSPYRPFARLKARVLDVVPAAPIPLDKGANQRAFGLVHHLNSFGIGTDLLLTTGSKRALPRLADVLTAVAPNVHTYRQNKPLMPARLFLRREAERAYRWARGVAAGAPDLFVERLATRSSRDGKVRLAELVATGRYDAVIINFAWMTGLLDAARAAAPSHVKWICDTHDVQFVRGATQNEREARLWVNQAAERRAELSALEKYDAVLAISESDRERLARSLGEDRVLLAPSGFDYARRAPTAPGDPLTFGFIGRSMQANVVAAERMLSEWWPAIRVAVPGSRLRIAGTICDARDVRRLAGRDSSIDLLAFVPTLSSFYRDVDVALNPVIVQGGLNFKSLEALAAGRLLVTTPLGKRCLGADAPVLVAEHGDDVAAIVRTLARDPGAHREMRVRAQAWCTERFSEEPAFAGLRRFLGA